MHLALFDIFRESSKVYDVYRLRRHVKIFLCIADKAFFSQEKIE
jgi:hypothetical protein